MENKWSLVNKCRYDWTTHSYIHLFKQKETTPKMSHSNGAEPKGPTPLHNLSNEQQQSINLFSRLLTSSNIIHPVRTETKGHPHQNISSQQQQSISIFSNDFIQYNPSHSNRDKRTSPPHNLSNQQ